MERLFPATVDSEAPLWASARKIGATVDLANKVEAFFRGKNLETNSTLLRALMNTECQDLLYDGIFFNPHLMIYYFLIG